MVSLKAYDTIGWKIFALISAEMDKYVFEAPKYIYFLNFENNNEWFTSFLTENKYFFCKWAILGSWCKTCDQTGK